MHFHVVYQTKGRTLAPSPDPFALSADQSKINICALMLATPSSHEAAKVQVRSPVSRVSKLRHTDSSCTLLHALERDGYRCIMSRRLSDCSSVVAGLVPDDGVSMPADTHCAHIFDDCTNDNLDDSALKVCFHPYFRNELFIILSLSPLQRLKRASPSERPHLDTNIHISFDRLKLCLQIVPGVSDHFDTFIVYIDSLPIRRVPITAMP